MELTPKHEQAIIALLNEPTILAAAKSIGIGESTLRRWMSEPRFKEEFSQVRRALYAQSLSRLQAAAGRAVELLTETMSDEAARRSDRLTAARLVMHYAFRAEEVMDIRGMQGGGLPITIML